MTELTTRFKDFYVYLHRSKIDGHVFYVGKGTGRRAVGKVGRSKFWQAAAKKHGVIVEIVESNLQEWAAFELESSLISLYGRKDHGLGRLCNHSDGGDGNANPSQECRSKIAAAQIKRIKSGTHQFSSQEGRAAQLRSILGDKNPSKRVDVREKIAASKRGDLNPMKGKCGAEHHKSRPVICMTNKKQFESLTQAAHWVRSVSGSVSSGQITKIGMVCRGERAAAYGYKWQWADGAPFELEIT